MRRPPPQRGAAFNGCTRRGRRRAKARRIGGPDGPCPPPGSTVPGTQIAAKQSSLRILRKLVCAERREAQVPLARAPACRRSGTRRARLVRQGALAPRPRLASLRSPHFSAPAGQARQAGEVRKGREGKGSPLPNGMENELASGAEPGPTRKNAGQRKRACISAGPFGVWRTQEDSNLRPLGS